MDFYKELRKAPFIKLLIPLIAGIMLEHYLHVSTMMPLNIIFFLFLLLLILFNVKYITQNYRLKWLFGILVLFIMFFSGIGFYKLKEQNTSFPDYFYKSSVYKAKVLNIPSEKDKTMRIIAAISLNCIDSSYFETSDKVLLYVQKSAQSKALMPGDEFLFKTNLMPVKNHGNPKEFDYAMYLKTSDIIAQSYIDSSSWALIKSYSNNSIEVLLQRYRYDVINSIKKYLTGEELAIANAIITGYKSDLPEETKERYAQAGVMHILAISGLHVGIIYMIFNYFLLFFKKNQYSDLVRYFMLIGLIWLYAIFTGMSPSVIRTAIMFTFIIVGKSVNRSISIYNSLSACAFFMLVANPFLLFNVGFQLSYVAVLSIVYYHPKIYQLVYFKNYIADKIWSLFAVGIAAQLGVFPIVLLYFHQFPVYFFIGNIIIVPIVMIVVILGFFVNSFALIPFLSKIFIIVSGFFIKIMNHIVHLINELPLLSIKGICFTVYDLIFVYLIIMLLTAFILIKKAKYLKFSLISVIFWLIINIYHIAMISGHKEVSFYNIHGLTNCNLISNRTSTLFVFNNKKTDRQTLNYYLNNHWYSMKLKQNRIINVKDWIKLNLDEDIYVEKILEDSYYISLYDIKVAVINDNYIAKLITKNRLNADYVLITDKVDISPTVIEKFIDCNDIIIGSGVKWWKIKKWKKECEKSNIKLIVLSENGAVQHIF
jgi:competence protein ComEC